MQKLDGHSLVRDLHKQTNVSWITFYLPRRCGMKMFMSIIAMAALFGFSAGTMPTYVVAQGPPPMPSPTDEKEKDKKPGAPRAGDEKSDEKKKDERGSR
jgi:hypothetical protein